MLNNLCFMVQSAGEDKAGQFNLLLQRQLPQITVRLQQTLEKLQAPAQPCDESSVGSRETARRWWAALQQRYARNGIELVAPVLDASAQVPLASSRSISTTSLFCHSFTSSVTGTDSPLSLTSATLLT